MTQNTVDWTLPRPVIWGFTSLEEWARDAAQQLADHNAELEDLRSELEDDRPICWEAGCPQEPVICRDHHELKIALATLRKGDD